MSGVELVTATQIKSIFNDQFDVVASCPSGKKVVGGGFARGLYVSGLPDWLGGVWGSGPYVQSSSPKGDLSGWEVLATRGTDLADQIVKSYAVCVNAQ